MPGRDPFGNRKRAACLSVRAAVINTLLRSQLREEISRAFTARIASEFSSTDAGLIDDASAYFRARSLRSSDQRAWAAGATKNAWRHPL
jgi:hypothetical protein